MTDKEKSQESVTPQEMVEPSVTPGSEYPAVPASYTNQTAAEAVTAPIPPYAGQPAQPSYTAAHQSAQATSTAAAYTAAAPQPSYATPTPVQYPATASAQVPSHGFAKTFAAGFAGAGLALLLGLGGVMGYNAVSNHMDEDSPLAGTMSIEVSGEDPELAQAVAQKTLPTIASINVFTKQQSNIFNLFGMPSHDEDAPLVNTSLGSGVVISKDGYILTNYHVVQGGEAYSVVIQDKEYQAEYVGSDPSSDIAVLKVDGHDMPAIEIGDSSSLQVGEWVMALGNPFGLENSVSTGIVSAIQRSSTMPQQGSGGMVIYPNMIQTDAAINPGNSGGALVDAEGKLIGINTMINSYSGSSSGVGFAIPIDYAMGLVDQILEGVEPTHAFLGVSMVSITPANSREMDFPVDTGVWVAEVYPDTAAENAGFEKGDIIIQFGSTAIRSSEDLALAVREYEPGDTVDVVLYRGDAKKTLTVTLSSDEKVHEQADKPQKDEGNEWGYGGGSNRNPFGF